eukprot:scaffold3499_cov247-Pinguiococcus_pyrenoidosus.AAC.3
MWPSAGEGKLTSGARAGSLVRCRTSMALQAALPRRQALTEAGHGVRMKGAVLVDVWAMHRETQPQART